jgi:hypothetical protein
LYHAAATHLGLAFGPSRERLAFGLAADVHLGGALAFALALAGSRAIHFSVRVDVAVPAALAFACYAAGGFAVSLTAGAGLTLCRLRLAMSLAIGGARARAISFAVAIAVKTRGIEFALCLAVGLAGARTGGFGRGVATFHLAAAVDLGIAGSRHLELLALGLAPAFGGKLALGVGFDVNVSARGKPGAGLLGGEHGDNERKGRGDGGGSQLSHFNLQGHS